MKIIFFLSFACNTFFNPVELQMLLFDGCDSWYGWAIWVHIGWRNGDQRERNRYQLPSLSWCVNVCVCVCVCVCLCVFEVGSKFNFCSYLKL